MAIVKLYPTSTSDPDSLIASGNHLDIDETSDAGGGTGDGAFVDTNTDGQTGVATFGMLDVPAASAINSATLRVRGYMLNVPGSNIDSNTYTIATSAFGASVTFDETDTIEGSKTSSLTSPTEAGLNSISITVDQTTFTQNMSPDGQAFRIEFIEIEVDYTPATATSFSAYHQPTQHIVRTKR